MKLKRLITSIICISMLLGNIAYAIPNTSVEKQENIYKGQVHLEGHGWQPKIEYTVGKDNIPFAYDKQYFYQDEDYEGYLDAKKVIITPKQKLANTYYTTEYKRFYKQITGTYGNKSNWNFSNTYPIVEDGYNGNIYFKNSSWRDNWVTGRTKYVTTNYTTDWLTGNPPSSISFGYYDSASGQTVPTNLNYIRTTNTQYKTGYRYSNSQGDRYNYSQNNENLGYMSQNSTTYYSNQYKYANSPRKPNDYYGPESNKTGWELVYAEWAEGKAYSADEVASDPLIRPNLVYSGGSYWWKSESGTRNKYRKGVYLRYRKATQLYQYKADYGKTVALPNYIKDYTGTASYGGTLSKQVPHTYYTCNYWDVNIIYEGVVGLKKVQVSGQIIPNPTAQGSQVTFDLNTRYYPNQIEIFIPSELQSYFDGRTSIKLGIKEEIYLNTRHQEILDLYISETIDKDGNRLKDP